MDQQELISVIIPTFNRSRVLEKTLRSVLDQTHQNLEAIVVDDGSPDDTRQVVSAINDNRIVYLRIPNSGRPAGPRNLGLQTAKGNLIAFCDDDDLWMPEKLAKQVAYLQSHPETSLVCTNAHDFPSQGDPTITFDRLLKENLIIISSVLVRKEALAPAEKFDEDLRLKAVEDYDFWLRVFRPEGRIGHRLNEKLVIYNRDTVGIGRDATLAGRRANYRKILRVLSKYRREPGLESKVRLARRAQLRSLASTVQIFRFNHRLTFLIGLWRSPCLGRTKVKLSLKWLGMPF